MPRLGKITSLLALTALLALLPAAAALAAPQALLDQAAAAYEQRAEPAQARQAATLYAQALMVEPQNEQAAWRLCRAWYWVGSHLPDEQAVEPFEKAVEAGKQAVAINPDSLPGHFWLGVAYASFGRVKGVMKSLALLEPIKEEMAWVIKKDPAYEAGGAYRVLGRLYFKVPGIMGGGVAKSIEHLKIAMQHGPRRWLNHLYLAESYIKDGQKDQAKALLEQVLAGAAEPGYEPEWADWRAEASRLMQELK